MSDEVFLTMRDIGGEVGLTSHQVGRKLKDLGLRTEEGRPSQSAFSGGFCAQKWTQDHANYIWAWNRVKVLMALAAVGVRPKDSTSPGAPN